MTLRRTILAYGDGLLAVVVGGLYVIEILTEPRFAGERALSVAVAVVFSATLAARRPVPLLAPVVGVGVIVVSNRSGPPLADTATFLFAFAVAVYSAGRYAGGRAAPAGGLIVLAALPLAVIEPGQPFSLADSAFIAIFIVGPWVARPCDPPSPGTRAQSGGSGRRARARERREGA